MIAFHSVTKQYGPKVLFQGASFQINPGDKVGLVGPNGNGKTTILRILAGEESVDEGTVSKPDRVRLAYFSQDLENMKGRSVLEEVKNGIPAINQARSDLEKYEAKLSEPISDEEMARVLERYGEAQIEFERLGGYDLESRATEILLGLGFSIEDQARDTGTFSGGWKMRIALAKILAQNPEVLLMDEPTNHLDLESIIWLEEWLVKYPGALIMTSHDRHFMNRLVKRIIEVNRGKVTQYSGNYDFFEKEREIRKTQLEASAKRQEEMLAKEQEFIARFAARASHAAQVQSRVKKLGKIERIEVEEEEKLIQFEWPKAPRGGDEVVKFEGLKKVWQTEEGREKLVFAGATALVRRQDRIAVVGVNGAGKSTLLKILAGHTEPTEGFLHIGPSTAMGYFSQNSLDVLNSENTIFEEVHSHIPTQSIGYVKSLLGALRFSGEETEKKIRVLSGGEKSRVVLATILAKPINFLILDEPTNHLDMGSREVLLQAIKDFEGTLMVVSHDRHFLKEITTKVFELDRHRLIVTEGPLDYYLEKAKTHSGAHE
jgi:ATP-binding cassette subfamily F protein 3